MKIVLDLQGAQTLSRYRGIGSYSISLAKTIALKANQTGHKILLLLNNALPEAIEDIRNTFEGIVDRNDIVVWECPEIDYQNIWRSKVSELIRERFIHNLEPDIVHISSFFETGVVSSIGKYYNKTTTAVTLYDLVPLINSDIYLSDPTIRKWYMEKLENLKNADLLLAISESARQEALATSILQKNDIITISSDVDSIFCSISPNQKERIKIKKQYGIDNEYIMCTSPLSGDPRKNVENLIKAYALLDPNLRKRHQLVLVGNYSADVPERMKKYIQDLGLNENEIILTGYVNQKDLVILYNLCKLFVFPSLHEGFGLPVLEAMRCGVPVIASNRSSIPEIIGIKEALFNPMSLEDMAVKMTMGLVDKKYRDLLITNSDIQSKVFSWNRSAQYALDAFELSYDAKQQAKKIQVASTIKMGSLSGKYGDMLEVKRFINTIKNIQEVPNDLNEVQSVMQAIDKNEARVQRKSMPVVLNGHINGSYSLASYNRGLAAALYSKSPHNTFVQPYETEATDYLGGVAAKDRIWLTKCLRSHNNINDPCVNIFGHYPLLIPKDQNAINIALFFWEESLVPENMIRLLNLHYDGVVVATNFVKKILIDSGLEKPIEVIGGGLIFTHKLLPAQYLKNDTFTFLHVSSCFPRKGIDILLNAYTKFFTSKDNVKLIIKTFPNPHHDIKKDITNILQDHPNPPIIELICEDLSEYQLSQLYFHADAIVLPTRGEGLNLPAAEAMFFEKPLITTAYSGHLDFCNNGNTWLVDYFYEFAATHLNGGNSSIWVTPDVKDLAKKMRCILTLCRDTQSGGLMKKQLNSIKKEIESRLDWSSVSNKTIKFCAKIAFSERGEQKHKLAWFSPWNDKCGIAEYSAFLLNEFDQNSMDIVVYSLSNSSNQTRNEGFNVRQCEKSLLDDQLKFPINRMINDKIGIVVIQYNFGLINFHKLLEYIKLLKDSRIRVVVVFHGTEALVTFERNVITDGLKLCDRILVHTPKDLNFLKLYGLVSNVTYFPHGVVNHVTNEMVKIDNSVKNDKRITIGTYGFFSASKGIYQLISAFYEVLREIPDARLILITAEYPILDSRLEINRCIEHAKQLGVYELIEWHTDFKSNEESLDKMKECDLLVFAYQNTRESSSAAVRLGLASGKPVLTTPIHIFDEVKSITYQTEGTEAIQIKEAILKLIRDLKNHYKILPQQRQWLLNNDWKKVGKRMQGMLQGLMVNDIIS